MKISKKFYDSETKKLKVPSMPHQSFVGTSCDLVKAIGEIEYGDIHLGDLIFYSSWLSFDHQMFKYKIKVSDARRAWMKNPEVLQNCSTGFHFPSQSKEAIQVFT